MTRRSTIGGALDPRMLHFQLLDREEQAAAIRRLAASGNSDTTIAAACGLSVEMIRRIIGSLPIKVKST